jgi:hypothetical protein
MGIEVPMIVVTLFWAAVGGLGPFLVPKNTDRGYVPFSISRNIGFFSEHCSLLVVGWYVQCWSSQQSAAIYCKSFSSID